MRSIQMEHNPHLLTLIHMVLGMRHFMTVAPLNSKNIGGLCLSAVSATVLHLSEYKSTD